MTPQPSPVQVLVVDDDQMSRDLFRLLLRAEGYTVRCAESGDAALELLRRGGFVPGLVLADVRMPGITGARLASELRRVCPPQTLLLAMSAGRPPEEDFVHFDGFLLKPFTMEQIAAALEEHSAARSRPAAHNPPHHAAESSRPRWTVVTGPAARSPSDSRLISIQASAPPAGASKKGMGNTPSSEPAAQAVTGSGDIPVLDEAIYSKLMSMLPAQQLREMYAMCIDDIRKRIAAMRGLTAASDAAAFSHQAHDIKGGCGMLGATELYTLASRLETLRHRAAAADPAREVNSLDELASACDRLERILASRV